mmetsp:Transcript_25649/g.86195  ORF Transcript_25649/g.86195 Transcript_25649/m.86195 type:complete len:230 (-) Transcript_25649:304-993(-)
MRSCATIQPTRRLSLWRSGHVSLQATRYGSRPRSKSTPRFAHHASTASTRPCATTNEAQNMPPVDASYMDRTRSSRASRTWKRRPPNSRSSSFPGSSIVAQPSDRGCRSSSRISAPSCRPTTKAKRSSDASKTSSPSARTCVFASSARTLRSAPPTVGASAAESPARAAVETNSTACLAPSTKASSSSSTAFGETLNWPTRSKPMSSINVSTSRCALIENSSAGSLRPK